MSERLPGQTAVLYRELPSVDEVLRSVEVERLFGVYSRELTAEVVREVLEGLRGQIRVGVLDQMGLQARVQGLAGDLQAALVRRTRPRLRRVINATGVVLQTNLGRAPLDGPALERVIEVATGYCNLEFDLETGRRSSRDVHAEGLVLEVLRAQGAFAGRGTDAEPMGAAVVNNCAAATFLALNTLAAGGEVVVSRGELVEIGGGFRIPEILEKSGAVLREVGTTNKTRIGDYAAAIGPATRLILRVHRSNFRVEGFTEQPSVKELVALGEDRGVPLFDDQGTGNLLPLEDFGIAGESRWPESLGSGVALVAASGDKLLGGPQCGLLVGRRSIVERLRGNPLFRALRVDKLTYAALEGTMLAYLTGREGELPAVRMLGASEEGLRARCERLVEGLAPVSGAEVGISAVQSVVGGGTTPGATLPSFAVWMRAGEGEEQRLASALRAAEPAVVARVSDGRVLLDLRTVRPDEDAVLQRVIAEVLKAGWAHA